MVLRMQHLVVGAFGFGTAVCGGYTFTKKQQGLSAVTASDSNSLDAEHTGCAFDRLAGAYDDIVGPEETGMWYGLMRWWLLRKAQVRSAFVKKGHHCTIVATAATYSL